MPASVKAFLMAKSPAHGPAQVGARRGSVDRRNFKIYAYIAFTLTEAIGRRQVSNRA